VLDKSPIQILILPSKLVKEYLVIQSSIHRNDLDLNYSTYVLVVMAIF